MGLTSSRRHRGSGAEDRGVGVVISSGRLSRSLPDDFFFFLHPAADSAPCVGVGANTLGLTLRAIFVGLSFFPL